VTATDRRIVAGLAGTSLLAAAGWAALRWLNRRTADKDWMFRQEVQR
jgi:hypothetical protein